MSHKRKKAVSNPMTLIELGDRLASIYASINEVAAVPLELPQMVMKPVTGPGGEPIGFTMDWDVDMSPARLRNFAESAIDNIAVLYNAIVSYAKVHGISRDEIEDLTDYEPLKIIRDLHNFKKHPEMSGTESKKNPRLRNLKRGLKLGPKPVQFHYPSFQKDTGGALITIEGDVFNAKTGETIIDLGNLLSQGMSRWEDFLVRHHLK